MQHFVNPKYAAAQRGIDSASATVKQNDESAVDLDFSGQRGLMLIALSALAALMASVAYEVMDNLSKDHLLLLWTGLWAALLILMTLLTEVAFYIAAALNKPLKSWGQHLAQSRAERRLLHLAQQDERVIADLQMAITKNQA